MYYFFDFDFGGLSYFGFHILRILANRPQQKSRDNAPCVAYDLHTEVFCLAVILCRHVLHYVSTSVYIKQKQCTHLVLLAAKALEVTPSNLVHGICVCVSYKASLCRVTSDVPVSPKLAAVS